MRATYDTHLPQSNRDDSKPGVVRGVLRSLLACLQVRTRHRERKSNGGIVGWGKLRRQADTRAMMSSTSMMLEYCKLHLRSAFACMRKATAESTC